VNSFAAIRTVFLAVALAVVNTACGGDETPAPTAAQSQSLASTSETKPNVLFIVADTMRADRLSATRNGKPVMPKMSAFAVQSWNFKRCTVQATWTKPSMVSMFTSLYPEVHKVLFGPFEGNGGQSATVDSVPSELETMAAYLKSNGYSTAGIQSNVNLHAEFGFGQGFDSYYCEDYPAFTADRVTDKALAAIEKLSPPFLCYVQYMDTHAPYQPSEEHCEGFGPLPSLNTSDDALLRDYFGFYSDLVDFQVGLASQRKFGNLSPDGEEHLRYKYDGGAHFVDAESMRLIEAVKKMFPNTVVVFTSDHGEELFEHGSVGHGKTVYEELTHVPLLIQGADLASKSIETRVESVDILPTLASLLGLPARGWWQGRDLTAADALPADPAVYTATRTSKATSKVNFEALIEGDFKLIVDNLSGTNPLFNLKSDPGELNPLDGQHETIVALSAKLDAHHKRCRDHPIAKLPGQRKTIDDEMVQRIRGIGYGGK
jgi:choline-sulfatase